MTGSDPIVKPAGRGVGNEVGGRQGGRPSDDADRAGTIYGVPGAGIEV